MLKIINFLFRSHNFVEVHKVILFSYDCTPILSHLPLNNLQQLILTNTRNTTFIINIH
jgi:hypothetical protein